MGLDLTRWDCPHFSHALFWPRTCLKVEQQARRLVPQNLSPIHQSRNALLSAGMAVVFINESVSKITGGSVASIGGVLAGASSISRSDTIPIALRSESWTTPVLITIRGRSVSAPNCALRGVGKSADRLLANSGGS